jgi:hypothetical protein
MNILFYTPNKQEIGKQLQDLILSLIPPSGLEVFRTPTDFIKRLHQPIYFVDVALLIFSNREELREMVSLSYLFSNLRIILILPDHQPETIALGHKLYPRFISFVDSHLEEVRMVLENFNTSNQSRKMIKSSAGENVLRTEKELSGLPPLIPVNGGFALTPNKIKNRRRQE